MSQGPSAATLIWQRRLCHPGGQLREEAADGGSSCRETREGRRGAESDLLKGVNTPSAGAKNRVATETTHGEGLAGRGGTTAGVAGEPDQRRRHES